MIGKVLKLSILTKCVVYSVLLNKINIRSFFSKQRLYKVF